MVAQLGSRMIHCQNSKLKHNNSYMTLSQPFYVLRKHCCSTVISSSKYVSDLIDWYLQLLNFHIDWYLRITVCKNIFVLIFGHFIGTVNSSLNSCCSYSTISVFSWTSSMKDSEMGGRWVFRLSIQWRAGVQCVKSGGKRRRVTGGRRRERGKWDGWREGCI